VLTQFQPTFVGPDFTRRPVKYERESLCRRCLSQCLVYGGLSQEGFLSYNLAYGPGLVQ
jgi:hypothetical protein